MITGIRTLADVEAIEQTPLAAQPLADSTYEHIARAARTTPAAPALHFFMDAAHHRRAHSWTFGQLLDRIHQTANLLRAEGVGPTDVVSFVLPNLPETHFVLWGAQAVGQVNPINPLLEAEGIAELLRAAGTRVLVTLAPVPGSDVYEKVLAAARQVPTLRVLFTVNPARYLPAPKRLAAWLLARLRRGVAAPVPVRDLHQALRRHPATFVPRAIQPDDVAALFHTGGTSGTPKLAQLTHRNLVFAVWAVGQNRTLSDVPTFLCGLPLFHINGVQVTGLLPLGQGRAIVLATPQGYRAEGLVRHFWSIIDHYQVGAMSGVPTVYQRLLEAPRRPGQGASLVFAVCGAAPCSVELLRRFGQQTGVPLLEGYGLTETACISTVNPGVGERRTGTVGLRLPYQRLRVVRLHGTRIESDCPPGEVGAIVLQGPNVFAGYTSAAANQAAWCFDAAGRWLVTGDLGRLDTEGYLCLTGRQKELIIRGGHNLDPAQIEGVLEQHPAVALAAAVGRPDAHVGEVPVAYVQLRPGHSATPVELLAHARQHLRERAAVPKAVRVLDQLPLTAVGKLFKPALVRLEIEDGLSEALRALPGVQDVGVRAVADAERGTVALVTWRAQPGQDPAALATRIRDVLGRFTVCYQLEPPTPAHGH